jgi:hypothetical protein
MPGSRKQHEAALKRAMAGAVDGAGGEEREEQAEGEQAEAVRALWRRYRAFLPSTEHMTVGNSTQGSLGGRVSFAKSVGSFCLGPLRASLPPKLTLLLTASQCLLCFDPAGDDTAALRDDLLAAEIATLPSTLHDWFHTYVWRAAAGGIPNTAGPGLGTPSGACWHAR